MSAAQIAQLLLIFGPSGIALVEKLTALWSKPTLTPDEVAEICKLARKSYESYVAAPTAA